MKQTMQRATSEMICVAIAAVAFVYGVGFGRYNWPPAGIVRALLHPQPTALADDGNYQARVELYAQSPAAADVVMLGDSLTDIGNWVELLPEFSVINRGIAGTIQQQF